MSRDWCLFWFAVGRHCFPAHAYPPQIILPTVVQGGASSIKMVHIVRFRIPMLFSSISCTVLCPKFCGSMVCCGVMFCSTTFCTSIFYWLHAFRMVCQILWLHGLWRHISRHNILYFRILLAACFHWISYFKVPKMCLLGQHFVVPCFCGFTTSIVPCVVVSCLAVPWCMLTFIVTAGSSPRIPASLFCPDS